jgi:hypothetical protein
MVTIAAIIITGIAAKKASSKFELRPARAQLFFCSALIVAAK